MIAQADKKGGEGVLGWSKLAQERRPHKFFKTAQVAQLEPLALDWKIRSHVVRLTYIVCWARSWPSAGATIDHFMCVELVRRHNRTRPSGYALSEVVS